MKRAGRVYLERCRNRMVRIHGPFIWPRSGLAMRAELEAAHVIGVSLVIISVTPHDSSLVNKLLSAPQRGQTQSSGRESKGVPGEMPASGSPFAGS